MAFVLGNPMLVASDEALVGSLFIISTRGVLKGSDRFQHYIQNWFIAGVLLSPLLFMLKMINEGLMILGGL